MDKKNTTIGVLLLAAGFAWLLLSQKYAPPAPPAPEVAKSTGNPIGANQATRTPTPTSPGDAAFAAAAMGPRDARTATISNDYLEIRLTDAGGAVQDIALKKYEKTKGSAERYMVNEVHAEPGLAFVGVPGLDSATRYELVSASATEVVYRTTFENRVEVTRRYTLGNEQAPGADPYQLRHETTFRNLTAQTAALPAALVSAGTAAPFGPRDAGIYLVTGHNANGEIDFINRGKLQGGGILSFFGMGSRDPIPWIDTAGPILWGAVNNQFFTSIVTPDQPAAGMTTRRVELAPASGGLAASIGITGALQFNLPALAPNGEAKLGLGYYVGPKDYKRLSKVETFKASQDKVMQFGMFKWFAQILLELMVLMHKWTANWGVAIVLSTLALKLIFLYPTISASKSAKRMQKIQPELQAVREKYKENPQKMQTETMAIFKKHRINPAGGCLPILITLPFFFGFYQMLQSNTDLRFAEFLWAKDLSAPDTVFTLWGLPINIMPLLLGATMIVQMRLVPTPSVDNMQMKMMKFMPWMFTLFCYTLPAGLSLYSTVNGLFTIGQQLVVNRMKDDPLPPLPDKKGKPVKNVTPRR